MTNIDQCWTYWTKEMVLAQTVQQVAFLNHSIFEVLNDVWFILIIFPSIFAIIDCSLRSWSCRAPRMRQRSCARRIRNSRRWANLTNPRGELKWHGFLPDPSMLDDVWFSFVWSLILVRDGEWKRMMDYDGLELHQRWPRMIVRLTYHHHSSSLIDIFRLTLKHPWGWQCTPQLSHCHSVKAS